MLICASFYEKNARCEPCVFSITDHASDIPDIAIINPDMIASMPKGLTASTGMDALIHAIEGYTTKAAWDLADCLNLEAVRQLSVDVGIPTKLPALKDLFRKLM